jgi:hypothetical protein
VDSLASAAVDASGRNSLSRSKSECSPLIDHCKSGGECVLMVIAADNEGLRQGVGKLVSCSTAK